MDYKIQSFLTIMVLLVFMVSIGVMIGKMEGEITGAAIAPVCKCISDANCNDNNECTKDTCLYQDTCQASMCINEKIENCP